MVESKESELLDLKVACQFAHLRYMQAQDRGADRPELMRLWVAFMDATKAVSDAKAGIK
jgi:hypothetical protein